MATQKKAEGGPVRQHYDLATGKQVNTPKSGGSTPQRFKKGGKVGKKGC